MPHKLSPEAQEAIDAVSDGLSDEGWRNTGGREILEAYARGETPANDTIYNCYDNSPIQLHEFLDELMSTRPATHEHARWYSYMDPDGLELDLPELAALRFANYAEAARFCLDNCIFTS